VFDQFTCFTTCCACRSLDNGLTRQRGGASLDRVEFVEALLLESNSGFATSNDPLRCTAVRLISQHPHQGKVFHDPIVTRAKTTQIAEVVINVTNHDYDHPHSLLKAAQNRKHVTARVCQSRAAAQPAQQRCCLPRSQVTLPDIAGTAAAPPPRRR
jgi:hypothetical protein